MAKKGVKKISGPTSPKIGQPAIYRVTEWYPGTPDALKSKVTWNLYKKRKSGKYTFTDIDKTGPTGQFSFGEIAINADYMVEGFLFNPELSGPTTIKIKPVNGPPNITGISIFNSLGKKFTSAAKYGQQIMIAVQTVNMLGEDLTVSLWERDTITDEGHDNKENTKLWEQQLTVENPNGIVKVKTLLSLSMAAQAGVNWLEGNTHEYYVLVESNKHKLLNYSKQELDVLSDTSGYDINKALQEALEVKDVGNDPSPENGVSPTTVGEEKEEEKDNECPRCYEDFKYKDIAEVFPGATRNESLAKELILELNKIKNKYEINTCLRKAHLINQLGSETEFRTLREEIDEYSVKTLKSLFGYFKRHPKEAETYHGNLYEIAIRAYGLRKVDKESDIVACNIKRVSKCNDLGNETKEDGFKYIGRGLIQLTGKYNYTQINKSFIKAFPNMGNLVDNPKLLEKPKYAVMSALSYWINNNLNAKADLGFELNHVNNLTKIINEKLHESHYKKRRDSFSKARKVFRLEECNKDEAKNGELNLYEIDYINKTSKQTETSNSNKYKFQVYKNGTLIKSFSATKNNHHLLKFPENGINWGRYGTRDKSLSDGDNWINPDAFASLLGFFYSVHNEVTKTTLYYNDISSDDGVTNLGHKTHKTGKDVDIRYPGSSNARGQQLWTAARKALGSEAKLDEIMTDIYKLAVKWNFINNYHYKAFSNTKNAAYSVHQNHFHIGYK